jgi:multimeric flavodoxin WrbA
MGKPGTRGDLPDLGCLDIAGWRGKDQPEGDFTPLLPKFREPAPGGWIIGSPCYFRSMSSITKCFLERFAPLRKPEMVLADKPVGVPGVGGFRDGGQELTIQQIHSILLCYGMLPVGGHPPAFQGATQTTDPAPRPPIRPRRPWQLR